MNTQALIVELSRLGVGITVVGTDLKVRAPKGVLTAELRNELAASKADLIKLLSAAEPEKALTPVSRDGLLQLSAAQQRFLLLSQLYPESVAYNLPNLHKLDGKLDRAVFEQAVTAVVERHEALRTRFVVTEGVAEQKIGATAQYAFGWQDLSTHAEPASRAIELAGVEANTSFNLETGPLLRVVVFQCSPDLHFFCWTLHHSISDGWSSMLFLRELKEHYEAMVNGVSVSTPESPVQYVDFSVWEREQIDSGAFADQLDYWRAKFADIPPTLTLPHDHSRPGVKTYQGKCVDFEIDDKLAAQCRSVSRAHGVTLFTLLLSAFTTLLHRYSAETDICIGTPIARRNNKETQSIYGCFINTLAIRSDLSGDPSVAMALSDMRNTCLEAFANQDIPFENVLEAVNPERDTSNTPLFQAMFIFHVQDDRKVDQLADIGVSPIDIHADAAKFDITLELTETDSGIRAFIEYSTDLFDRTTIERMAGHYSHLLLAMTEDQQSRISTLPMLAVAEQQQLLSFESAAKIADSEHNHFDQVTLPGRFQQITEQYPHSAALVCNDHTLDYQQLDQLSDQVAHALLAQGQSKGSIVGVCMNRSTTMVVALLGVMKSGAAYLPLDPAYPSERLIYMLETAEVSTLLTDTAEQHVCANFDCHRVNVDTLPTESAVAAKSTIPFPELDALAYVIFTSGSTGKPKGVQVSQRSMMNFLSSMSDVPGLNAADKLLSVTTPSFDISVLELFLPLMLGATVIIADQNAAADGRALSNLLTAHNVTVMQATPSTWQLILEAGWHGTAEFKALCGGEPIPQVLIDSLLPKVDQLWNMYGPTETTVWSTCYRISDAEKPVLIGKPIRNTRCTVLDRHQQPVPIGVPGELYIGGAGVSAGYLHNPEQTKSHFFPDPDADNAAAQLYRTGDAVRWRDNGCLEYLARIDDQVKIRGHRIELGEVESALAQLEGVMQAAVSIITKSTARDTQLVGYIVASRPMTVSDVRHSLGELLPAYMIPSAFVFLQNLPLTANGKINKKALPEPDTERPSLTTEYVNASNDAEVGIAAIWRDTLSLDSIGINDNFFDLGGHSLLLVSVHAAIESKFDTKIPLLDLFRHTTIKSQAQLLQGESESVSLEHTQKRAAQQQQMLKRLKRKKRTAGV